MATISDAIGFSRAIGQTDSVGLTNANGLIFANEALLDFRRRLISNGIDAAQLQEAYTDMTANTGTYLYPTNMWWLKAIELNYGGSVAQDYIRALQADVSNLPNNESFGWLRKNATTQSPYFDDRGDWFEIFPTPVGNNSAGIKIFYFLEPTEYSSVSDNISYPESLDYRVLSYRIIASYYRALNKFTDALQFDVEYEKRVKDIISTLGRGTQQPIQATVIPITGWEF